MALVLQEQASPSHLTYQQFLAEFDKLFQEKRQKVKVLFRENHATAEWMQDDAPWELLNRQCMAFRQEVMMLSPTDFNRQAEIITAMKNL